uniref:Salivary triabin 1 n=1 Tax=Triatoma matogrossensis TaxID=162370 RepID=E2J765_9HEMI
MKTIIVVTFFGILTYVCAYAYTVTNNCSEQIAMRIFEPEKFFKGKWYLGHGNPIERPVVCQIFHTNDIKGFTLFVESGYNKLESKGINGKYICDGGKKRVGQYTFNCQSDVPGVENTNFVVDLTILYTDYYGYAQICKGITFADGEKEDKFYTLYRTLEGQEDENFC